MTVAGDMLPSAEGGETAARTIMAPALLREGDMVDVVRVEGGFSGVCAPFWLRPKVRAVNAFKLIQLIGQSINSRESGTWSSYSKKSAFS
jgi:hypothetical protein